MAPVDEGRFGPSGRGRDPACSVPDSGRPYGSGWKSARSSGEISGIGDRTPETSGD